MKRFFAGYKAHSFVELLRRRAEAMPEAKAFIFLEDGEERTRSITYSELDRRARAIGAMLADRGAAGERVLLPLPQGLDFLIAFFGCLYAGAVAVPLAALTLSKSRRSLPRIRSVSRDAQARFAFILDEQIGAARDLLSSEEVLSGLELLAPDAIDDDWAERWRDPEVGRGSLAFLQYTSGSTSEPKGVMVGHGNLLHNSEITRLSVCGFSGSVVVTWLPSFHDMGLIGNHLQAVYCGAPCVFMTPTHFLQKPSRWLSTISRYRGTISGGPNFAYELCASRIGPELREGLDLRPWNTAFNGAEPVRPETLARFAETFASCGFRPRAFMPCYGLAEATLIVTGRHDEDRRRHRVSAAALKEDRVEVVPSDAEGAVFVGCGGTWLGQRVAIVNPDSLAECPPGQVGEIWVSGGSVAGGYWNRPEESKERFRARIAGSVGRERYLRTGDLGFLVEEDLCVTGRLKDLIVIRGQNHYPQDVEWTVQSCQPAFAPGSSVAFSIEAEGEERLVVVQELKRGASCDLASAVAAVRRRVAEEHELELWGLALVSPGSVLKTTSGKVQRRACRAAWLDGSLQAVGLWSRQAAETGGRETGAEASAVAVIAGVAGVAGVPAATVEAWLVERLAQRLGTEPARIDPQQTFASHGVDSAAAVSLAGELGERFGRDLPATVLYDHPTPAAVARFLAGDESSSGPAAGSTAADEPIAIIGIGCRFPGARGPRAFWQLLREGKDAISEVPASRWDLSRLFDPDASAPGKMSSRWGGFLDAVDEFDATHFGISPREAERMDPQQRLLLEVAWEALEDSGQRSDSLRSSATGVFVGLSNVDYAHLQLGSLEALDAYAGTGSSPSIAANRLSFFFDFRGPSLAVDTACSSSLVAVHLACQSLRSGECSLALAGGVNVIVDPAPTVVFSKAGLLALDGRCKVFDSRADGYVRSEGCGLLVLKPLSCALADGDPVYAVIRGSAINQDGRSNGLTAPSRQAQESVLRDAWRRAGVAPGDLDYVELHGTGTELGDPIEALALGSALAAGRSAERPCAIGSVKSNLGHLEAAAGAAGLIKVALSLRHGEIPPSLHFRTPNPKIPFAELPIAVQTGLAPWPGEAPGLAGVSSFGFGGTNAHVVLAGVAAPPAGKAAEPEEEGWKLLPLSARTAEALDRATAELASAFAADPGLRAADAAWTLQTGRARFAFRRTVVCRGGEAAVALARLDPERAVTRRTTGGAREVAFLLPGLGDHYPGMAAGLYRSEPVFRAEIDRCCEVLNPLLGLDLCEALFATAATGAETADGGGLRRLLGRTGAAREMGPLADTASAQPAVFAVDWSLARLLASWGIEPAALLGYSLGEYVAAALAGVFSLEDALTLVVRRARLIADLPRGAMLAVPLSEEEVRPLFGGELSLAAVNGPAASVVAGTPEAVADLERDLVGRGVVSVRLQTSHAFHSRLMEPLREAMTGLVAERPRHAPKIPFLSNVTGGWITAEQACDPQYWADHLCGTVRFADGLAKLLSAPERVLLEVGPGQTLGSFAQQHPAFAGEPGASVLASLPPQHARQPDEAFLLSCLGKLWLQGIEPDWQAVAAGRPRRRVALPPYSFERERHWLPAPTASMASMTSIASTLPTPAGRRPDPADWFYRPVWRQAAPLASPDATAGPAGGAWLILADELGLAEQLRAELERSGAAVVTVRPGEVATFGHLLDDLKARGLAPRRIVHLWGITGEAGPQGDPQELGYGSVVALVAALAARGLDGSVELTVVADGLFRVEGGEALWPEKATVLGPCLVAPQEHPEIRCRTIDLSAKEVTAGGLGARLFSELVSGEAPARVALRTGGRWVEEMEAVRIGQPAPGAEGLRPQGVYLILGGLGGVGLAIAAALARKVQARLVLVGRSEFPERAEWPSWTESRPAEDPVSLRMRQLRELEAEGAEVLVLSSDAADPAALKEAVRRTLERFGALHGVVHAAGSVDPKTFLPLAASGEADRGAHFLPKVAGTLALAEALAGHDLDFRMLTSSISTVLGGLGFAAYVAANAFLDVFALAQPDGRWLSVDWDGWLVGDRRAGGIGASVAAYAMTAEEGGDAFLRLVGSGLSGRVVQSTGNLAARRAAWDRLRPAAVPARREAEVAPLSVGGGQLERRIAELWQRALGIRQIGVHDNFFDLGGNSLIGVQLVADLRRELGVRISNVTLFEAPTVAALARLISRTSEAEFPEPAPAPTSTPAARRPFQNADIAVVGMAGRFPGAANVEQLWRNLRDGVESISFFSDQELLDAGIDAADLAAPEYVKARPILDEVAGFDAHFFGFSPREAALMDPQHRIFMECSWLALEDAGYDARQYGRPIGMFAGCNLSSYMLSLYEDPEIARGLDPYQMVIGNDKDSMPTAVSYKLDLKGPSVAVQTHCSTSLVAVHLACQSLLMEECDMAMAGGVSIRVPQKFGYRHQEGGQESPDGHCRSFDAAAGGTVFGDGAGVVVLKRLEDALADGDTIRAVIKGSAINNDGSLKVGYTAPSVEGQSQAIQRALARAGVDPATISYVEGHGSATRLGDPIEVAALTRAFRTATDAIGFCALGSVKSNVGHLDRASGVTGLIKTVLALQNRTLPATLHFRQPNPESDLPASPFYVNAETRPWPSEGPRRAGVNSLGMGGTNAHLVLEEAPEPAAAAPSRGWQLLVLSARTEGALEAASGALADHLSRHPVSLADAAHTLQAGRRASEHRRAVLARDLDGAIAALRTLDARQVSTGFCPPGERQVAFLFPGLGDHYVGMARELYRTEAVFRERVDRCAEILRPYLGLDLRTVLYPEGEERETASPPQGIDLRAMLGRSRDVGANGAAGRDPFGQTAISQPAVFVVNYALAGLWMSWGVRPWAMIGYSLGEYVAACLSGVMTLEDALMLVARRARLIQDTEPGGMLAVPLAEAAVLPRLAGRLSLAAINGPAVSVVGGPVVEIEELERRLAADGIRGQRLQATHAFHSGLLEPIRSSVAALVRQVELREPRIPFLSNLTGSWITPSQATDPDYWAAHMCETVRFEDGLQELLRSGCVLLEVGPGQALSSSALQRREGDDPGSRVALPSLRHRFDAQSDLAFLLATLGKLWLAGVEIDWTAFRGAERRRRIPLPTYPFERRPYWIEARRRSAVPAAWAKRSDLGSWFFTPAWRRTPLPQAAETATPPVGDWLLFADERGLGDRLAARLRSAGARVVSVRRSDRFEPLGEESYALNPAAPAEYELLFEHLQAAGRMPSDVAHLWSLDAAGQSAAEAETLLESGFYSLLFLAQAIGNAGSSAPLRVHAVSANACDVLGGELLHPLQATLLGPFRVLPQEYPNLACRLIDVDLEGPEWEGLTAALVDEMNAEMGDARVAYRGRYRWVERFEPSPLPPVAAGPGRLRDRGVYLITGGLGGLGLAIAEHLARTVRARLVLLSRSGDPAGAKAGRIAALKELGAEVLVVACDVADAAQLAAALGMARERFGAIHGVVHAAGVPGGGLTQRKGRGQAAAVLAPKVRGTLLLDEMLRGDSLDFLVLFSSSSSLTGGLGEADYCAANAFLDAFAHRPAGRDGTFTVAVNWGPWQWDAWQDDLLQGLPELRERIRRMRSEFGIAFSEGCEAFARILEAPHSQVAVLPQGAEALIAQVQSLTLESFLGGVEEARAARPRFRRPQLKNPFVAPTGLVEPKLAEVFQDLLGVDEVGADDAFFDLGGNSLVGLQVVARAQKELGAQLSVADLFNAPTVRSLAALIEASSPAEASSEAPVPILKRSAATEGPLSHGQLRLWFLARLEPLSPMHNESLALRILGRFHPPALVAAFTALCARHEALRSSFADGVDEEDEPRQIVHPPMPMRVPLVELRGLPPTLHAAELDRVSRAQVRTPFDLGRAPLVRLLLVRLDEEHRLLFVIHHIVHDGRSGVILMREAAPLYAAIAAGRPAALPHPAVRYLDFARWERAWLRGPALEGPLDQAVRRLSGAPTLLDWKRAARPRPPRQSFRAGRRSFELPANLSRAVLDLGPRFQASLFMTALAAYGVLLHFHTLCEDLLVASPVENRGNPGTEGVLGLFANLQVLRLDLSGDPTFREILLRVRAVALEALEHQALPFDQLVDRLQPVRDPSHPLLVQAHLSLENEPLAPWREDGVEMLPLPLDHGTSPYELDLNLVEGPAGLTGEIVYSADLFDADSIVRAIGQFEAVLRAATASPETRLSELRGSLEREELNERQRIARSLEGADLKTQAAAMERVLPPSAANLVQGLLASPQQRRLWTLRLADGGGAYTAHAVVRIDGAIDRWRLDSALRAVASRYEIFHTVFAGLPGMSFPVQIIESDRLPRLEEAAAGASVEDELRRLAAEVQDVGRGPLLRMSLVPICKELGKERSHLILVLPALCADGSTMALLLRRIFEAYDGREGEGGETLQYADLASWQNDILESDEAEESRRLHEPELWQRRAAALPFAGRSGGEAPAASVMFSPSVLPFRWGREIADAVTDLAGREGVEPGAVLLTAWLVLLSRLSGERDLVVGVTCDGREVEDLAEAAGPLAKTLPLRAPLVPGAAWSVALSDVADSLRFLTRWQEHFSLFQLAALANDRAAAPYFPVGFQYEDAVPDLAAAGLVLGVERCQALGDRFDLALACRREGGEIVGEIRFDAAMLDGADVRPLAGRLAALLSAACRRPKTRLDELPILAEDERRIWLVEKNDTRRASTLGATLPSRFEARAGLHPDRSAVTDEDGTLSYGELEERANRIAHRLRALGAGPEALVAVCIDRSVGLVAALLGVLKAGAAYVPLDPTYPEDRLALLLAGSGARLLVTTSGLAGRLSATGVWNGATLRLDRDAEALAAESAERPAGDLSPQSSAYVIYTSGSTGTPKGVMISHGAICNRLLWMQEEFPLDSTDRLLQKTPASFDASVWELFCPLFAGAHLELARPRGHQDAEYLVHAVAERGITVLQLVPSALRMVLEVPGLERCTSLRRLYSGGEALPADLRDRFFDRLPADLVNLYGPTEVSIDATFHVCRRDGSTADSADGGAVVPIGTALSNTRLYLLNPEPVVPGAAGELYVGGAGLSRGYLGRPDLTAERFVPDPLSGEPGARLYRTGDLARFGSDGSARFLGRADHQIKIRGFRIEPGEIEAALVADPNVRAAVVAAREAAPGDLRLYAWIVLSQEGIDLPALRERLAAILPEHMIPAAFVVLDELPLLPNGKLDRAALPAPAAPAAAGTATTSAPLRALRTPVEDLLAGLWSDILGRDDVGLHDDVFHLGAHSLLVTQLVSRLRRTFRVDLPMRTLFDEPTVAQQARRIEAAMRGEAGALPALEPVARDGGPLPVSSAQRRLWFLDQLDPGSSAYSTPLAFRLTGRLRVPLLAAALDRLVERHETLRTTFPARDGQPVQRIGAPFSVALPVIDVSALPHAGRREESERLLLPSSHPPFDLAEGPLLRVAVLRLAPDEHLVLGALHHIVSDAWSTWVAVRELDELYGAQAAGRKPNLPSLAVQYADFAVWQQDWLRGGELATQLDYWRAQLAGAPPTLDLPTDFPRPAYASPAGDLRSRRLSPTLLAGLRDLSRRERSSLYMTLLSAWYVLLLQLTGREDLVVGTSVAARDRLELEGMIGFFINVVALRTSLSGDPPFSEVLRRVRETALEGYLHQAVPFDRLLEELQAGRDRGRNPLFQVAFTFENVPGRRGRLGDLELEPLEMRFDTSLFDLALVMEETDHDLWSGMRYMTTLFRPATIDHWLAQLETLLARVVEDPSQRVSELLDVLAGEERRRKRDQEAALAEASLGKLKTRSRAAVLAER